MPAYSTLQVKAICHVLHKLKHILKMIYPWKQEKRDLSLPHVCISRDSCPTHPSAHYIIELHHQNSKKARFVFLSHAKVAKSSSYFIFVQISIIKFPIFDINK